MKKTLFFLILAIALGIAIQAYAYRDLETGAFLTRDPLGNVDPANGNIAMPKEKWMVDGKSVTQEEYEATLEPGIPQFGNGPTKTAKSAGQEADAHVAIGSKEKVIPGEKGHYHTAAAGFPNLYTYVNDNPWTFFDPEGLDRNQSIEINLATDTLRLFNGTGNDRKEVLNAPIVHGEGTTKANTTPVGNFTLGPWQKDKTNPKYGAKTSTPWSKSSIGYNAYGPYFAPVLNSDGVGIHGTIGLSKGTWSAAKWWSPTSHGCVRVPNETIINMHDNVLKNAAGTKVKIINKPAEPPKKKNK